MKTLIYPEPNITYLYNGIKIPNCAPLNNNKIEKKSPNAYVDFGKKILSVKYCEYDLNFNKQISINAVDLKGWTIICDFGMNVFTSDDLTIKRMDTGETYIFEDKSNIKLKNYDIPGYDYIDRDIHNYRIIKRETYNNKVKYSFTTNWKEKYCECASSSYNYGVSNKDILKNTHVNSLGIFRVFEEFTLSQ